MGRWVVSALAGVALLGACSSPEPPPPEEVETCDGLVEVGVGYVDRMIVALEGQPLDVVTGEAEPPPEIVELQQLGGDLDLRAARLGCDAAELNAAINEEIADYESDDPIIAIFLDVVRNGVIGELPPAPATTTTGG
jgi:hypothetical protein